VEPGDPNILGGTGGSLLNESEDAITLVDASDR
jgi:hypothetical protein